MKHNDTYEIGSNPKYRNMPDWKLHGFTNAKEYGEWYEFTHTQKQGEHEGLSDQ